MANQKISDLATASALTGAELIESVQGGVNKKTTTQDIANLVGGLSKPLTQTYITIEDLLQDQGSQVAESWYGVIDASDDAAITSGWAVYEFNGTATGVIGDYTLRLKQEEIEVVTPPGNSIEINRAFTDSLLFDKNEIVYAIESITSNTTLTLASSGHLVNQMSSARMRLVMDGVSSLNFGAGFDFIYGMTNGQTLAAGTYELYFLYLNGSVSVNVPGVSSQTSGLVQLGTPGSFSAVSAGEDQIDLSWTDVSNESSYLIEFSLTGTGGWATVATPAAGSTSASHTGLTPGVTYYYRIEAIGDGVNFTDSAYATASATTSSSGDVTAPTFTFSPVDTATGWGINEPIVITADEAIRNTDGSEITNANVASRLTLKETNSSGSDITFSATINTAKTIITIIPTTSYGANQVVYVAINNVEDNSGNEVTVAESITFTTSAFTFFNGTTNKIGFGDILDSLFVANDTNFWLEATIKDVSGSGIRYLWTKYDNSTNNRSFMSYILGSDIYFYWWRDGTSSIARAIKWTGVYTPGEHTVVFKYDGSIDTNDGLDRVTLEIDTVVQGSKTLDYNGGGSISTLSIFNGAAQLAFGAVLNNAGTPVSASMFSGDAKDIIIRSAAGATVEINVPLISEGTDTSGNGRNGTWV